MKNEHIFLITMLTIKIPFTINSLKKTIPSRHYLQFLSFKKKLLVLIRKIHLINNILKKLFKLRTLHLN